MKERKLVIVESEATVVRSIFSRFAKIGSGTKLARELAAENVRNRYGKLIDKGAIYKLLNNRTYIGEAVHKGTAYPGKHQALIGRDLWEKIHDILKESPRKRARATRVQTPSLLKGLIFGPSGRGVSKRLWCSRTDPSSVSRKPGLAYALIITTAAGTVLAERQLPLRPEPALVQRKTSRRPRAS